MHTADIKNICKKYIILKITVKLLLFPLLDMKALKRHNVG